MKIERELMRGAGPVAVLKLLQSGPMYGYELVSAIAQRSDGILAIGQSTLYPMLYNLESQGFVQAEWRDGETGRRRKYYALTAKGERRLASDTEQWRSLETAMRGLGILPDPNALASEGGLPA
jgi:PadR family transcriptional regulator, regulatory protein PadR